MKNNEYSWKFDDNKNRGKLWYIIAFSLVIGLSVWGFLNKQYGLSFIILIIAGLTYFVENNSQDNVEVQLKEDGVNIAGTFYDYSSLNSFCFVYKGEKPVLLRIYLNKKGLKYLDVKIKQNQLGSIRDILLMYIDEEDKQDFSFIEKLINTLKL